MEPAELEGAPLVHRDPSSLFVYQPYSVLDLKQDFLASLRDDLTSNHRPVIMNLTEIAGENIIAATTIAKALEEHIQRVSLSLSSPTKARYRSVYIDTNK
jgi:hypothetical protein